MPLYLPTTQSASWSPSDHGLVAWTGDPSLATATTATTNGTVYLARVNVRSSTTISTVWYTQTTGPTTPTASQNYAGLYDSSGNLLSSAGLDAKTSNGIQSATLGAAQSVAGGTFLWVALVFNAATPPVLMKHGGQSAAANIANLTAATARWAVNGTGATALASTITPSSNSQTSVQAFWAAVS